MNKNLRTDILSALQYAVELNDTPFAGIAKRCGVPVEDVVSTLRDSVESGHIRRFGAVFDAKSLGYASTLAALDIPAADLEVRTAFLETEPAVTHAYERSGTPNFWFTLTAHESSFNAEQKRLENIFGSPVYWLPATRRYKVEAVFGLGSEIRRRTHSLRDFKFMPDEMSVNIVRMFQTMLPLTENPFRDLADQLNMPLKQLLKTLNLWHSAGILRRIGAVLRHVQSGVKGNGMGLFHVSPGEADKAGHFLAAQPDITHCYFRPAPPEIPGNLYAMLHAETPENVEKRFEALQQELALPGKLLLSKREFQKRSPLFFR